MKITLASLAALMAALFLFGCTIAETGWLFNNTGKEIIVTRMSSASNAFETNSLKLGAFVELHSFYKLSVSCGGNVWHYESPPFALALKKKSGDGRLPKYYIGIGGGQVLVKMQIEKDGTIYLIPPRAEGICTNFLEQPKGFPLRKR